MQTGIITCSHLFNTHKTELVHCSFNLLNSLNQADRLPGRRTGGQAGGQPGSQAANEFREFPQVWELRMLLLWHQVTMTEYQETPRDKLSLSNQLLVTPQWFYCLCCVVLSANFACESQCETMSSSGRQQDVVRSSEQQWKAVRHSDK